MAVLLYGQTQAGAQMGVNVVCPRHNWHLISRVSGWTGDRIPWLGTRVIAVSVAIDWCRLINSLSIILQKIYINPQLLIYVHDCHINHIYM